MRFLRLRIAAAAVLLLSTAIAHAATTAYDAPVQPGNQNVAGSPLGLDFDVKSRIVIRSLGAFDANGDGFTGSVQVAIFDRTTQLAVTPTVTFSGTNGVLVNGQRFLTLANPVVLNRGKYSVVAGGFSSADLIGNAGCVGGGASSCIGANPYIVSTENSAGGAISFVGGGRYGGAGTYPATVDGGPSNRYLAGTFQFDPLAVAPTVISAFGAVAIPAGSATNLTFKIANPNPTTRLTGIGFADVLPAGLVLATPNGLIGSCVPGAAITAAPGTNSITISGLTIEAGASCSFSVDVRGIQTGAQMDSTGPINSNEGGTGTPASAEVFVGPAFQVGYASNLIAGDSIVNITNSGANGASLFGPGFGAPAGNICVNVYAFAPDEQLISCCSCLLTPDGLASVSVVNDLVSNTLTSVRPNSVVVKLLATATGVVNGAPTFSGASCANSAALVTPGISFLTLPVADGLIAWRTTTHAAGVSGAYQTTETPLTQAHLSPGELASIGNRCAFIIGNGGPFGVCRSCRPGALGAIRR